MFFKRKPRFNIGDKIIFIEDFKTCDMFGIEGFIKKGTNGITSDKNVVTTVYDIKYIKNFEVTYGNKQRVLIEAKTKSIRKAN